jgi:hypothetical protein
MPPPAAHTHTHTLSLSPPSLSPSLSPSVTPSTDSRTTLVFNIPLAEVVTDYFDQLKSRSKGYASMEYKIIGYRCGGACMARVHACSCVFMCMH